MCLAVCVQLYEILEQKRLPGIVRAIGVPTLTVNDIYEVTLQPLGYHRPPTTEEEFRSALLQPLRALKAVHEAGYVLRDIRNSNFLCGGEVPGRGRVPGGPSLSSAEVMLGQKECVIMLHITAFLTAGPVLGGAAHVDPEALKACHLPARSTTNFPVVVTPPFPSLHALQREFAASHVIAPYAHGQELETLKPCWLCLRRCHCEKACEWTSPPDCSFRVFQGYFFSDLEGAGRVGSTLGSRVPPELLDQNGMFPPKSDLVLVGKLFPTIAFHTPTDGRPSFRQRLLDGDFLNAGEALADEWFS